MQGWLVHSHRRFLQVLGQERSLLTKKLSSETGCPGPVLASHCTWGIKLSIHQALVMCGCVSNHPRLDKQPFLHRMGSYEYLGSKTHAEAPKTPRLSLTSVPVDTS